MPEEGPSAELRLIAKVMSSKIEEASGLSAGESYRSVFEALGGALRKELPKDSPFGSESHAGVPVHFTFAVLWGGEVSLTAHVGSARRITAQLGSVPGSSEVFSTALAGKQGRHGGGHWEAHDLPEGGASSTQMQFDRKTGMAYVAAETHYSHLEKWNPSPGKCAETCFYPNGNIRWRRSFVKGQLRATGDLPLYESFWENGTRQVVEYGSWPGGKHRDRTKGPAYTEFYPNGAIALCVFAQKGRRLGLPLFFSGGGVRREPTVSEMTAAKSALQCSRLTSPSDWVYPAGFISRHRHCVEREEGGEEISKLEKQSVGTLLSAHSLASPPTSWTPAPVSPKPLTKPISRHPNPPSRTNGKRDS